MTVVSLVEMSPRLHDFDSTAVLFAVQPGCGKESRSLAQRRRLMLPQSFFSMTMVDGPKVTIKTEKESVTVPAADIVAEETPPTHK